MLRDVQDCTPVFRRDWVDSRRGPGFFLESCRGRALPPPACCPPSADRPVERSIEAERSLPNLRFARYLHKQNRESPDLPVRTSAPTSEPRHHRVPHRIECARLGDVPPQERTILERRVRTVYRIELPLKAGRILDVLA